MEQITTKLFERLTKEFIDYYGMESEQYKQGGIEQYISDYIDSVVENIEEFDTLYTYEYRDNNIE